MRRKSGSILRVPVYAPQPLTWQVQHMPTAASSAPGATRGSSSLANSSGTSSMSVSAQSKEIWEWRRCGGGVGVAAAAVWGWRAVMRLAVLGAVEGDLAREGGVGVRVCGAAAAAAAAAIWGRFGGGGGGGAEAGGRSRNRNRGSCTSRSSVTVSASPMRPAVARSSADHLLPAGRPTVISSAAHARSVHTLFCPSRTGAMQQLHGAVRSICDSFMKYTSSSS